eukprot:scaffold201793_cov40-Prasinocladus_malaysianus.AAC.1
MAQNERSRRNISEQWGSLESSKAVLFSPGSHQHWPGPRAVPGPGVREERHLCVGADPVGVLDAHAAVGARRRARRLGDGLHHPQRGEAARDSRGLPQGPGGAAEGVLGHRPQAPADRVGPQEPDMEDHDGPVETE